MPTLLRFCLLAIALMFSGLAGAQTPTETALQNGRDWLAATVQADGSLLGETEAIALPGQTRSESALALHALQSLPTPLRDVIHASTPAGNELVARRALVLATVGLPDAGLAAQIEALQNSDGGYGAFAGQQSSTLDTALALQALARLANADGSRVGRALAWLNAARVAAGGFGENGQADVYTTAQVLLAANAWSTRFATGTLTAPAKDYLLGQRNAEGGYGEVFLDASALLALAGSTSDAAVLGALEQRLLAAQSADGSWLADPYQTALALRALRFISQTPTSPTTAEVSARVIDATTGTPLAGVLAQVVELADVSTTTAADGNFVLGGLAAGQYTLRLSQLGYERKEYTLTVAAGESLRMGDLSLRPAPLTATIYGVVRSSTGAALSNALVAVGTASVRTNASGAYELAGITSGPATIDVTLSGYRPIAQAVVLEAGYRYAFSPTLYQNAQTPPTTATLRGKAVDAASNLPIAGATVVVAGVSRTTLADGKFEFTGLVPGAFSIDLAAPGYFPVVATGSTVAGVNDLGQIAMTKMPQTSTLVGTVIDAAGGNPVPGATLVVQGQAATTLAGPDGRYTLNGIVGTQFTLITSAPGFLSNTLQVGLPQVGVNSLDVRLTALQDVGIRFSGLSTNKPIYQPNDELELEIEVLSVSSSPVEMVVAADVRDELGNLVYTFKANAQGLGENPPNLPISFAPNALRELELEWMLMRQPAGVYTISALGTDSNGRVLAEATTRFTIAAAAVLAGGVTADPPLTQVDAQTPVHLSAELTNFGNLPIPAGDLRLQVILDQPDTQGSPAPRATVTSAFSGAPLNNPRDLVRAPNGDYFVLNVSDRKIIRFDAQNVASVFVTLPTSSSPDSLAIAPDGTLYAASSSQGSVLQRISPTGAVTTLTLRRLNQCYDIDVASDGSVILNGHFTGTEAGVTINEPRLLKLDSAGTETVLWAGGMSSPIGMVKAPDGALYVTGFNENALYRVDQNGRLTRHVAGLNRPRGITVDAQGNFYVTQAGDNSLVKISGAGVVTPVATGLNNPHDVKLDAAGNAYVADFGSNTVLRIAPDGSKQEFARGVAQQPRSMRYAANGDLYVVSGDGSLRRKTVAGQVDVIATSLATPRGLALLDDGSRLVTEYSAGKLTRIAADGTSTALRTGLSSPDGVAVDASGRIAVVELGTSTVTLLDAAGGSLESVPTMLQQSTQMVLADADAVYVANAGFVTRIQAGVASRFGSAMTLTRMAFDDETGDLISVANTYNLQRTNALGTTTAIKRLSFAAQGLGTDAAGNILALDSSGRRLVRVAADGSETVAATFAASPTALVTDRAGNAYVQMGAAAIHRVNADGTSALMVTLTGENVRGLSVTADGKLLAATYSNRSLLIDPVTSSYTTLPALGASALQETRLSDGSRIALLNSDDVIYYTANAVETARVSGYYQPHDIVWTGDSFYFNDVSGDLFSWEPGSYPRKRMTAFASQGLDFAAGVLLGADGASVYRWTGSGRILHKSMSGGGLAQVAMKADGSFAAAVTTISRIYEFDAQKNVVGDYLGIAGPTGLVFAANGDLIVSNYNSGTIARIDVASAAPRTLVMMSAPKYLSFAPNGDLWVTTSAGASQIRPDGTVVTPASSTALNGILFDGSQALAVGASDSTLRRWTGSTWEPFVSSLTRGPIALDGEDRVLIAGETNRTLSRFDGGAMQIVARSLPLGALGLARSGADNFIATGAAGIAVAINALGDVRHLHLQTFTANGTLYGAAFESAARGKLLANSGSLATYRLYDIALEQSSAPPAAGTVVHEVHLPMAAMPPVNAYTSFDFGDWTPTFGGDFRVVVERVGITGSSSNFVHVGPSALATLTADRQTLPPGDQSLRMCLNLSGADFTSLSRVEVSRIRPLVSNTRPSGMVADRAGNIYYTTTNGLHRTTPSGSNSTLATGLATAFGLGIDDAEVLYFPNRNSVTGKFELMRSDLNGSVARFVDLDVASANGVAVDSLGNVLVGTAGRLLKVSPAGAITAITTPGLPSPRGITIDGHDNVYVQNEGNFVSMVRPDGTTFELYSGGDGDENPGFEGDGYPNITADCSSNLYIATSNWRKIGQVGEEHIMAQIVPRTGQVGALFDGHSIAADLTDIDYLAYDRFGDRILFWQDYYNRIWQAPVTCGAIGVEAHLTTLPGQVLSGMSRAPSATIDREGGRKEYVWSLRNVTAEGEAVCFDAPQDDLLLGELRQTLHSGFMSFENTFAPGDIEVPIAIPNVRVEDLVGIVVGTDRPEYRAGESALITTTLTNDNPEPVSGVLSVRVFDAHDQLVVAFNPQEALLPATGQISVEHVHAIAAMLPGNYRVLSELRQGEMLVADADTEFAVLADNAPDTVSSRVATDKAEYDANERVTLLSRASNLSANLIRENLTLQITVRDPQGAVVFTHGHFMPQLLPGAGRDFTVVQQLDHAVAGTYPVEQQLLDAEGRELDVQTTSYLVRSGAETGVGLGGSIGATPNVIVSGAHVALASVLRNEGNAAIAGLPVRVAVVDVQAQQVLTSWAETVDVAVAGEATLAHDWNSARVPAGDYTAVLSATVAGVERVLDQDEIRVNTPDLQSAVVGEIVATPDSAVVGDPVQLQSLLGNSGEVPLYDLPLRVQVLAADGSEVAVWTNRSDLALAGTTTLEQVWDTGARAPGGYRAVLSLQLASGYVTLDEAPITLRPAVAPIEVSTALPTVGAGRVLVLMTCRNAQSAQDPACTSSRANFLDAYLTELGVSHRIVTTTADFEREFRSGRYNVYWISGGAEKLANTLAEEVREATWRGDGLIVEGNHDSRNQILDEALGVKHVGQLPGNDHGVVVTATTGFAATSFIGRGDALKYQLLGEAQRRGGFDGASGSPAVVSNVHGEGEAVTFAFGLTPTLMQEEASAQLRQLVLDALNFVVPDQEAIALAGGFAAITAEVHNLGEAANVDLVFSVDAPATIESTTPQAPAVTATSATWSVQLAAGESKRVVTGLRLPLQAGPIVVRIAALRPGSNEVLAESTRTLTVRTPAQVQEQLAQTLAALNLSGQERAARDQALNEIARGMSAADARQWDAAFRDLLKARDRLLRISSVPMIAHRAQLAELLRTVELAWFRAQAQP